MRAGHKNWGEEENRTGLQKVYDDEKLSVKAVENLLGGIFERLPDDLPQDPYWTGSDAS